MTSNKTLTKLLGKAKISAILIVLIIINSSFAEPNAQKIMTDKSVVKELDLQRYLGTWYEIARYDHSFERGLVGVTANYSLRSDGMIRVLNSGYKGTLEGKYVQAVGKARIPDRVNEPARLQVSFFLFFYSDYLVFELDKDYQWAVIGSRSDNYLWILSRTPEMNREQYNELLEKIKKRGYDLSGLIMVEQKVN